MATYQKNPKKKGASSKNDIEANSTTAEVFTSLDETASRSEQWVSKNQNTLLGIIGSIVLILLTYMAYNNYIQEPKERIAANLMSFPKLQFNEAMRLSAQSRDSVLKIALNGKDDKLGFIAISEDYASTNAGNLSNYYAGIGFQKMNNNEKALEHLQKFSSDDEFLGPITKGAIGDIYSDLNQSEKALTFYKKAANLRGNSLTTPIFLFKSGSIALQLKNYQEATKYFKEIKKKYPNSEEAKDIDSYLNKAKFSI